MKRYVQNYIIEAALYILMGLLMILATDWIVRMIKIPLGLFLILTNLADAIYGSKDNEQGFDFTIVKASFYIFLGIAIMIWGLNILSTLWGVLILIPLVINTLTSKKIFKNFKDNIGEYLFAFVLIAFGLNGIITATIHIAGGLMIIWGIRCFYRSHRVRRIKHYQPKNEDVFEAEYTVKHDEKEV